MGNVSVANRKLFHIRFVGRRRRVFWAARAIALQWRRIIRSGHNIYTHIYLFVTRDVVRDRSRTADWTQSTTTPEIVNGFEAKY